MKVQFAFSFILAFFFGVHAERPCSSDVLGPTGEKGDIGDIGFDNLTGSLLRGYMKLDNGWIAPFNGYQYKENFENQSWTNSRITCQSWGEDLIVYGFRSHALMRIIDHALGLRRQHYWIGLHDVKGNEADWQWVAGHRARADDVTLWANNEPNDSGGNMEDCGTTLANNIYGRFVWDSQCRVEMTSICEKLV